MAFSEESGMPLLRVHFRDAATAHLLRLRLARLLRGVEDLGRVASDPDQPSATADLLAWPSDPSLYEEADQLPDQLFVEDTQPFTLEQIKVPSYEKKYGVLNDEIEPEVKVYRPSRVQECFNCDGNHLLQSCPHPKNFNKINQKRKEMKTKNLRYHAEEQTQDDKIVPGKISRKLRHALGLERNQIPVHIYRMRYLGYPPGWLLNAKVSHSGISLFDSSGNVVDSDDEKSSHPGSKDEYDINKIIDFPGFNVPAGSKYIDESGIHGYLPYNEDDSKMLMIERLAPRAARAYKRKKMAAVKPQLQPGDTSIETDMDIDNAEFEHAENGDMHMDSFVPPLPTEDLPPPPPSDLPPLPPVCGSPPPPPPGISPQPSPLNITNEESSRSDSPSLADLESQKLLIMAALEEKEQLERNLALNSSNQSENGILDTTPCEDSTVSPDCETNNAATSATISKSSSSGSLSNTPDNNGLMTPVRGRIRDSVMGTPVQNFSPFNQLPTDDKFSKDICDVINFENLPDSTGKYVQMSGLIKKVRESITKIQQEL